MPAGKAGLLERGGSPGSDPAAVPPPRAPTGQDGASVGHRCPPASAIGVTVLTSQCLRHSACPRWLVGCLVSALTSQHLPCSSGAEAPSAAEEEEGRSRRPGSLVPDPRRSKAKAQRPPSAALRTAKSTT